MIFPRGPKDPEPWRIALYRAFRADEPGCVQTLLAELRSAPGGLDAQAQARLHRRAYDLVAGVRAQRPKRGGLDVFLQEYGLSSREGVVLMCLAEALLRTPDAYTADLLISDKVKSGDWFSHLGHSSSVLVNASTWALMLTGRVIRFSEDERQDTGGLLRRMVGRSGEPMIRQALNAAMRILGRQFVMGRTIAEALKIAAQGAGPRERASFDMLGEAARTRADAERYFKAYESAIDAIGRDAAGRDSTRGGVIAGSGISVKLSALHPRFEIARADQMMAELVPLLRRLALAARDHNIPLCVDAEESERLELSLDVIAAVFAETAREGWDGFGLAVQAYQKRAPLVIARLGDLSRQVGRPLQVRLVKGAYWDTEIKRAQERGLAGYAVYTRKCHTDVSYLACARRLLAAPDCFFPQFATHNAHTIAAILEMAAPGQAFEFQRLHGMGETLYAQLRQMGVEAGVRVYAPVGGHEDLLAYLVRRLLENGANTSFVNRVSDLDAPIETVIADPVAQAAAGAGQPHPRLPLPRRLYGAERDNALGLDLADPWSLAPIARRMTAEAGREWTAAPIIGGQEGRQEGGQEGGRGAPAPVFDPATRRRLGTVVAATAEDVARAVTLAARSAPSWDATPAETRAQILERAATLMEERLPELMALCVREAGKTLADAVAEVREAVDYCRYYAQGARRHFAAAQPLPGPTGERNSLRLCGRGVFACISPWNFPLAIFTGQVTAALAAGNAVIAKPAEQTPLIAARAVRLLHEAGVPPDVLHLLPGAGEVVGAALSADERIDGIAFTGSLETAQAINRSLAARKGAIVPLIAETGGQNAMIVDSTALAEQVVADVVASAFQSAGQRCSATRLLLLQEDVADRILAMLAGAMAELRLGDPAWLETDIGPIIDEEARTRLEIHGQRMEREARLVARAPWDGSPSGGLFFAPRLFEIDSLSRLEGEVFGPVLHVLRWRAEALDELIDSLNALGYGLTLGVHSRIDATAERIARRMKVGNVYINRSMIGAVVGVQPFGGMGLSGTGPKAGGPHTLFRFATEKTVSVDTTAAGGNASLLTLAE